MDNKRSVDIEESLKCAVHEAFKQNTQYVDIVPVLNPGQEIKKGQPIAVKFSGRNKRGIFGYGPGHIICMIHNDSIKDVSPGDLWTCIIVVVHYGKDESKYLIVDPVEKINE